MQSSVCNSLGQPLGITRPRSLSRYGTLCRPPRLTKTYTTHGDNNTVLVDRPGSSSSATLQDGDATTTSTTTPDTRAKANLLVDELLQLIHNTDSGENISNQNRLRANDIIRALERIGTSAPLRPLQNPLIWGNYNVAYVSQGNDQGSPPAGGRYRTGVGKLLFKTTGLFQSVLQPDVVTNKVQARLFGILPVSIGLRGNLVSIPEVKDGPDTLNTVKVFFDPPEIALPGGIATRFGPSSSVVLTTTYVDDRVRLGRGSRGSLFVFTRGDAADTAGMDSIGLRKTTAFGALLIFAVCAGLLVGGGYYVMWNQASRTAAQRVAGVASMVLGVALTSVFMRGGVVDPNNYDRPEVKMAAAASVQP